MAKTKLDIFEEYDFLLYGISSHVKDYRLCWAVNNVLDISLKKNTDALVRLSKETDGTFSLYSYLNEKTEIEYRVVSNYCENGYLIPEQKQIDFFLIIEGYYATLDSTLVLQQLREMDFVLTAYEINPEQLKSKQNLLFE